MVGFSPNAVLICFLMDVLVLHIKLVRGTFYNEDSFKLVQSIVGQHQTISKVSFGPLGAKLHLARFLQIHEAKRCTREIRVEGLIMRSSCHTASSSSTRLLQARTPEPRPFLQGEPCRIRRLALVGQSSFGFFFQAQRVTSWSGRLIKIRLSNPLLFYYRRKHT